MYIKTDPSINNCYNSLNNNAKYTTIWAIIPYAIKIKTDIVKLFSIFRQTFDNTDFLKL